MKLTEPQKLALRALAKHPICNVSNDTLVDAGCVNSPTAKALVRLGLAEVVPSLGYPNLVKITDVGRAVEAAKGGDK